jgi:hypothetical protein
MMTETTCSAGRFPGSLDCNPSPTGDCRRSRHPNTMLTKRNSKQRQPGSQVTVNPERIRPPGSLDCNPSPTGDCRRSRRLCQNRDFHNNDSRIRMRFVSHYKTLHTLQVCRPTLLSGLGSGERRTARRRSGEMARGDRREGGLARWREANGEKEVWRDGERRFACLRLRAECLIVDGGSLVLFESQDLLQQVQDLLQPVEDSRPSI